MKGAIRHPPLGPGEALVIPRARQVHTFGMTYALDVIFCDDRWRVRHVDRALQPRRITKWVFGSRYVIEMPGGKAGDVVPGDNIVYSLSDR